MAMIHVNRNRETLGKFTDQEVADGLKSGQFLPTDLAWKEPMPAWQPLSTFTDLPKAAEEGVEIPQEQVEPATSIEPAWERAGGLSVKAGFETVKQVLSEPSPTFKNLPATGPLSRAFFYFLLLSVIGSWCAIGYDYIAAIINPDLLLSRLADFPPLLAQIRQLIDSVGTKEAITAIFVSSMIIQPIFLVAGFLIFSLLAHGFLILAGAAEKSFSATFRALAYSSGTGFVFQLMPLVGVPVSWIASLVLGIIALKEVHQTSIWRVVLAAVLMVLLSCGLLLVLGIGLGVLAGGLAPQG